MSSSIWTRCAGSSEIRPLALTAHRAVEAQHQIATRKLVDSDAEQQVLEELIEGAKPAPRAPTKLHYLLSTPFRYPPLRHGSRFGARHERGIWYGAERLEVVLAEVAYYRLLFLEGTRAELGTLSVELSSFRARVAAERGIDLLRPPFDVFEARISSPTDYRVSQALGRAMRDAGVELCRYRSARDPAGGSAVAVFSPSAFAERRPRAVVAWWCNATRRGVEFRRRDYFHPTGLRFRREDFLVGGALPAPAP